MIEMKPVYMIRIKYFCAIGWNQVDKTIISNSHDSLYEKFVEETAGIHIPYGDGLSTEALREKLWKVSVEESNGKAYPEVTKN